MIVEAFLMKFLKQKIQKFGDSDWNISSEDYDAVLKTNPSGGELLRVHGREYVVGWTVRTPEGKTVQWGPPVQMQLASGLLQE